MTTYLLKQALYRHSSSCHLFKFNYFISILFSEREFWPLSKNSGPNPRTFRFVICVILGPGHGPLESFPSSLKTGIRHCLWSPKALRNFKDGHLLTQTTEMKRGIIIRISCHLHIVEVVFFAFRLDDMSSVPNQQRSSQLDDNLWAPTDMIFLLRKGSLPQSSIPV